MSYPELGSRERWIGPWRYAFAWLPTRLFDDTWIWLRYYQRRRYAWTIPVLIHGCVSGRGWYRRLQDDANA